MSSDRELWGEDDPDYLEALLNVSLSQSGHPAHGQKRKRSNSAEFENGDPEGDDDVFVDPTMIPQRTTTYADSSNTKSEEYVYGAAKFRNFGEYMFRKRAKLQIQNDQLGDTEEKKGAIFKDVAIYVNGFTDPPFQDLREMMMAHGGVFHAYMDRKSMVTHIIASQLTPAKILEYQRGKMKVVKPEWIVQSVAAGVRLRWQDFALQPGTSALPALGKGSDFPGSAKVSASVDVDQSPHTSRTPQQTLTSTFATQKRTQPPNPLINLQEENVVAELSSAPGSSTGQDTQPKTSPIANPSTPGLQEPLPHPILTTTSPTPTRKFQDTTAPERLPADGSPSKPSYAMYDSNPAAARLMESTQWRNANTSANAAAFTESYFQNSRLHHLSMWKSELRKLVAEARERSDSTTLETETGTRTPEMDPVSMQGLQLPNFKGKGKAVDTERVVMHCDFDSFFVAAGLVDRPHLKGKPVVVCHSGGGKASTSELASASYEARKFGIKNGMSLGQARQLCPDVQTIPYEFEKYKTLSLQFYTILMTFADDLQAVSVDEALVDVSERVAKARAAAVEQGDRDFAKELAEEIRDKMRGVTGCEVSIGIAHNIMLARMATRHAKPAGSYHLLHKDVAAHISQLSIRAVHGVGRSIQDKIVEKFKVETLGELSGTSKDSLQKLLGEKTGDKIWKACRGIDDTPLESDKPRKSVSAEVNYGIRFENDEQAKIFIYTLSAEVSKRLKAVSRKGRSLTLKVMVRSAEAPKEAPKFLGHGSVDCFNKTTTIGDAHGGFTDDAELIGKETWKLLEAFNFDPTELRGIGIQIQKLDGDVSTGTKDLPAGQSRLQFPKPANPQLTSAKGKEKAKTSEVDVIDVDAMDADVPSGRDVFDIPTASQIDPAVLDSLPQDIRDEILTRLGDARAGVGPSDAVNMPPFDKMGLDELHRSQSLPPSNSQPDDQNLALPEERATKAASMSPTKAAAVRADVRHITRQLAPKRKIPVVSPTKLGLFRKQDAGDDELRALGIDVHVFKQLPKDIQREQLSILRQGKPSATRSASLRPSEAGSRGNSRSRSPSVGIGVTGRPKPTPIPVASYTTLPQIKKLSKLEDVERMIQEWVKYRRKDGPITVEIDRVSTYLVKCAATDIGLENATSLLRLWRQCLRQRWPAEEKCDSDVIDLDASAVGQSWWSAFRGVKEKVDEVVKIRFGCKLGLGR